MLESPPHITHVDARQTAVIHLAIPRSEMRSAMGPAIAELMAAVKLQGAGPAGPWFSHHLSMHADTVDVDIGVPVSAPVAAAGRVRPGSLPAVRVARVVWTGDYNGLPDGWAGFLDWVAAHRFPTAPGLWEVYLKGPESDPDPASWRTELNKPLID